MNTPTDSHIAYLLVCAAEEASEITKECLKAVRFGLDTDYKGTTPRGRLKQEVADLLIILDELTSIGAFEEIDAQTAMEDEEYACAKMNRLANAMEDSRRTGLIRP